jgi:hypothetical protein
MSSPYGIIEVLVDERIFTIAVKTDGLFVYETGHLCNPYTMHANSFPGKMVYTRKLATSDIDHEFASILADPASAIMEALLSPS